jgi:hypothetical protein
MSSVFEMAELSRTAHFLRGAIISSYAQVEFLLTELNMRCRQLPEYAEIAAARAKELAEGPGPVSAYANDLLPLVARLSDYEDFRHFIAHGLMVVSTRKTATAPIIFRMYRKAPKTPEEYGAIESDADQLRKVSHEISEYARQIATLVARIVQELSLEPGVPLELNG